MNKEEIQSKNISWYPGHIKVAEDQLKQKWLPLLDLIIELIDSRVPVSGKYPNSELWKSKPIISVFTKKDLTDLEVFSNKNSLVVNSHSPHQWKNKLQKLIKEAAKPTFEKLKAQGRQRKIRLGICGLPNVGKSTFLNSLSGLGKKARTGNMPGVTRQMQWIPCESFDLLDTPGIIPYSLNEEIAYKLSACGLIPEKILDPISVSRILLENIRNLYPNKALPSSLEEFAISKNFQLKEKEMDLPRAAKAFIKNFQEGNLGRICLDHFKEEN